MSGRTVIAATGVWSDDVAEMISAGGGPFRPGLRVRASKGVHLVVPRSAISGEAGLILRTDKSVLFVIPWGGHWIVGTTDTDWRLDRAHPAASAKDIEYLLGQVNRVLDRPLSTSDIEGVWAGLRPLLAGEDESTSALSREHAVVEPMLGLMLVAGGKLTTYRVMAADVVDHAVRRLGLPPRPSRTDQLPLLGADGYHRLMRGRDSVARRHGVSVGVLEHLIERYGSVARDVLALVDSSPRLGRPLAGAPDYLAAEIAYAATAEGALHLEDALARRTRISFETAHRGVESAPAAADLMGEVLGWDADHKTREIDHYLARVEAERESQRMPDDLTADAARLGAPDVRVFTPLGSRSPGRRDPARPAGLAGAGPALVPPGQRRLLRRAARLRRAAGHPPARLRRRPLRPAGDGVRDRGLAGRPAGPVAGDRAQTGRGRPAPPQAPPPDVLTAGWERSRGQSRRLAECGYSAAVRSAEPVLPRSTRIAATSHARLCRAASSHRSRSAGVWNRRGRLSRLLSTPARPTANTASVQVRVLPADRGHVGAVPVGRCGQDGQVGVHEQAAVAVARDRVVARGQPDEPGDLGDLDVRHAQPGQHRLGEQRARLLVVHPERVVHRVVEPGGQSDRVRVGGPVRVAVDDLQHGDQVLHRVVVTLRLAPPGEQVGAGPQRGGLGGRRRQRVPPGAQKVAHVLSMRCRGARWCRIRAGRTKVAQRSPAGRSEPAQSWSCWSPRWVAPCGSAQCPTPA